jgi:hypothetical protein
MPNKYDKDNKDIKDIKDNIILRLQQIISELENENKELCKKLGLIYRPRIQFGGKNDPKDGDWDGSYVGEQRLQIIWMMFLLYMVLILQLHQQILSQMNLLTKPLIKGYLMK